MPNLNEVVRVRHSAPPIPAVMQQLMDSKRYYIYNVGPKSHTVPLGTMGQFLIPACPEGEEYSDPVSHMGKPGIPAIVPQNVVTSVEGNRVQHGWDMETTGEGVAKDIIGTGLSDRRKYGVFLAADKIPTAVELEAANQNLQDYYDGLIREADQAYEINGGQEISDNGRSYSAITQDHVFAVKALGLDKPWARKNKKMVPCPACDEPTRPGAAICSHCDAILDEAKARQFFPHKFGEEKRGPGRPRKDDAA